MVKETCFNSCFYFHGEQTGEPGECRRYPPKTVKRRTGGYESRYGARSETLPTENENYEYQKVYGHTPVCGEKRSNR